MLTLYLAAALAAQPPTGEAVWIARSSDALSFGEPKAGVLDEASAPDAIELSGAGAAGEKGTLLVYALDRRRRVAARPGELVRAMSSDDGKSWSDPQSVHLEGRPSGPPLDDLAVVQLPDGRLRLYFTLSTAPIDPGFPPEHIPDRPAPPRDPPVPFPPIPDRPKWPPPPPNPPGPDQPTLPGKPPSIPWRVYSAVSVDGRSFTTEDSVRLELPTLESPEVLFNPSTGDGGQWFLFYRSGGEAKLARSRDGLAFEGDGVFTTPASGALAATTLLDGRVRLFFGSADGLSSAVYDPRTATVTPEPGTRLSGHCAAPSVVPKAAGGYLLFFARSTPARR